MKPRKRPSSSSMPAPSFFASTSCGPASRRSRVAYAHGHEVAPWWNAVPKGLCCCELPPKRCARSTLRYWWRQVTPAGFEGAGFALAPRRRSDQFAGGSGPPLSPREVVTTTTVRSQAHPLRSAARRARSRHCDGGPGCRRPQEAGDGEAVLTLVDDHGGAVGDLALEQRGGQPVGDLALDHPLERAGRRRRGRSPRGRARRGRRR